MLLGLTTYNHYNFTYLTLKYIEKYTDLIKNRVVVVDNGSADGTLDRIEKDFPFITLIKNDINSQPKAFNILISARKIGENYLYCPNDIIVSPNWLELLEQDANKYENVGLISPYIPFDLNYDDKVNEDFKNHYFSNVYPLLKDDPSIEDLENYLNILYDGDYEKFCLDFSARNKNENMLDESLTHVMYYKSWLFDKYNLKYDEEYCPWGNEDRDFFFQMNNLNIYRACSSRVFCHHWLSITQRQLFHDADNWREEADRKSIRLLQKWEPIKDSETYLDIPKPNKLENWRSPYRKFKLREQLLPIEEAKKISGIKFMKFDGLHPGVNYFNQIMVGSILRKDGENYKVIEKNKDGLVCNCIKNLWPVQQCIIYDFSINEKEFIDEKWHVDYYWRPENPL